MDTLHQDIRYAVRRLAKNPAFTLVALLTLALGIGANTAIFSVVHGVLLKPLPYPDSERLVGIFHVSDGQRAVMSGPNFMDVRQRSRTLESAAAVTRTRVILTGHGEPVRLEASAVTASLFDVLKVQPALGRRFTDTDNQPGRTSVTILSHGLWRQQFAGNPSVVGSRVTLDGESYEVVGVMPDGFSFPAGRALWTPLEFNEGVLRSQRGAWYLNAVGRVRPEVSLEQAKAEVETIGAQLAQQYPDDNESLAISVAQLHDAMVGDVRRTMYVLLGAVGFVLLIACVNVANLLLARAAAREGEIAVRTALGAGRARLVRQLLTESLLLSVVGGLLGLLLAVWGVELLLQLEPQGIPRLAEVAVNGRVAAFSVLLSVVTGFIFGAFPALHTTRSGLALALKEAGRGALTSRGGSRLRSTLVVAEVALAVTLLAGAGLLIRSFSRLAAVDPGFDVRPALTFTLTLPDARYEEPTRQAAFFDQLLPRLEALPGVQQAAAVSALPFNGNFIISFEVGGRAPVPPAQRPAMQIRAATTKYFDLLGIPLKRGRLFTDADRIGTTPVVLITESAARQFFADEDPIGRKITLGMGRGPGTPRAGGEVVGVVGDVKDAGLSEAAPPTLYLPYQQWPMPSMSVTVASAVPPSTLGESARRTVYSLDPNLPVSNVRTLDEIVARSISQPRFYMTLLTIFAGVAVALAAIGIFGVLSYAVAQRTREIGIRMALGAYERTVILLVLRDALVMAGLGLAIGMAVALPLTKTLIATLLYETPPNDPVTFTAVAVLLVVIALAAAGVPARRATRVDPIVALRAE